MYLHWEIFCWRLMKSALLVCGSKARNAQPSLSKQLMELEKKLGKQLLIRGKKKNHPYRRRGYPAETEIGWEDIKYSKCTYKFYYALFFIFFNCYNDLIKT